MNDKTENKKNLEARLWFRLVKVIYIGAYCIAVLFVFLLSSFSWPYKLLDSEQSTLICENGNPYELDSNGIFLNTNGTLADFSDDNARKLCKYNIIDDYGDKYETPLNKNYELQLGYSTRGSWGAVILTVIIGLTITSLVFEIIRRVFLYIVVGKSVLKS